jgi:hypothetical protein
MEMAGPEDLPFLFSESGNEGRTRLSLFPGFPLSLEEK